MFNKNCVMGSERCNCLVDGVVNIDWGLPPAQKVDTGATADVVGNQIKVGDTIVYFTCRSSGLYHQKAWVEYIGPRSNSSPHILVRREDAEQKNSFTRKAWLWSFANSVKVS